MWTTHSNCECIIYILYYFWNRSCFIIDRSVCMQVLHCGYQSDLEVVVCYCIIKNREVPDRTPAYAIRTNTQKFKKIKGSLSYNHIKVPPH